MDHYDKRQLDISIHAPHTGRDTSRARHTAHNDKDFNPRAPYGARPQHGEKQRQHQEFQSTRPIRGATTINDILEGIVTFQSTRPIRGATALRRRWNRRYDISIHAPHTGRDSGGIPIQGYLPHISIHAPHTGRDGRSKGAGLRNATISIHAPHTGRDQSPV